MIGMLETGTGFWNPLVFMAASAIILIIVYAIRSVGTKKYKKGTGQDAAFFCGNDDPGGHIRSSNIYWGFFEATKRYYRWVTRFHTGIVNDYIYSLVLLLVIVAAALLLGGMA